VQSSRSIKAEEAKTLGLVDVVVESSEPALLLEAAIKVRT
jgi:enoyl-CoA hydratase/carnithine racemase